MAKIIKSPNGVEFEKGQKVFSFGDPTTFGFVESWDLVNKCWRLEKEKNVEGAYFWLTEDEPQAKATV
ncbi:hypothetical protein [uncultured Winogradskyella sp.]|uniref:hypothetical protein n=1 Tax=uncultured Winogradskyella sp. TaxID=395353 RepID=UPI00262B96D0|nr:hypothetical protein [uncultured Winogradskyella sp.]